MFRLVLRILNAPLLLLILLIGIGLETSLFNRWPVAFFQPDLGLLLIVWFALRRSLEEGGLLTLIVAHIIEINSHMPQGFGLTIAITLFSGLRYLVRYLLVQTLASYALVAMIAFFGWKLLLAILFLIFGVDFPPGTHWVVYSVLGAAAQGVLALIGYPWLERLDTAMYKPPLHGRRIQESWHEGV